MQNDVAKPYSIRLDSLSRLQERRRIIYNIFISFGGRDAEFIEKTSNRRAMPKSNKNLLLVSQAGGKLVANFACFQPV